jgi:hypothetical protein
VLQNEIERILVQHLYATDDWGDRERVYVNGIKDAARALSQSCVWEYQQDGHCWSSGCSHVFQPGAFRGSEIKYCPWCGGRIEAAEGSLMSFAYFVKGE